MLGHIIILLFAQFAITNIVCTAVFWLDLFIRQSFPRQNFVTANSPNFTPSKLSSYTVFYNSWKTTKQLDNKKLNLNTVVSGNEGIH